MTIIESKLLFDQNEVAGAIRKWFMDRNFDTEKEVTQSGITILAGKKGIFRTALCAARSFHIEVENVGGIARVKFSEDSWKTNLAANTAWFIATGGANLVLSAWSYKILHDFKNFVRELLCVEVNNVA